MKKCCVCKVETVEATSYDSKLGNVCETCYLSDDYIKAAYNEFKRSKRNLTGRFYTDEESQEDEID